MSQDPIAQQPASSGGVWDYVSPSRLNTYLNCPLKFRLKYIDGLCEVTTPSAFLGKLVHQALAYYYQHQKLGITLGAGELLNWLAAYWPQAQAAEKVDFASQADETALKKQAGELVLAYLTSRAPDEPAVLAVEQSLKAALIDPQTGEDLGLPLVGILDLLLDDISGPLIVDFKTASRSSQPQELLHELQLTAYSYLLRQASRGPESGLELRTLVKTRVPQVQAHRYPPRNEMHFRRFFAVLRDYLDHLESGRFNLRPNWGCVACPYRESACSLWTGDAARVPRKGTLPARRPR
jgi:RecB family exonuclease